MKRESNTLAIDYLCSDICSDIQMLSLSYDSCITWCVVVHCTLCVTLNGSRPKMQTQAKDPDRLKQFNEISRDNFRAFKVEFWGDGDPEWCRLAVARIQKQELRRDRAGHGWQISREIRTDITKQVSKRFTRLAVMMLPRGRLNDLAKSGGWTGQVDGMIGNRCCGY